MMPQVVMAAAAASPSQAVATSLQHPKVSFVFAQLFWLLSR